MIKIKFSLISLLSSALIILVTSGSAMSAMNAKEIMARNEDRRKIDDVYSKAVLTTGGGGGQERVKQFNWWRKLNEDQVHFNTFTRFELPAEVRGEGILFLEHDSVTTEILMYLPNFKKTRRVEGQQQSGSFMGSEFSYSDIATPHLEDYQYRFLRHEPCPVGQDLPADGAAAVSCAVVEAIPVSDELKERTGYSKILNWVRSDNDMVAQAEYTNAEGALFKRMNATEIKNVDPKKNKWMSHQLRIVNLKSGRFTSLQMSQVKVNQGIKDAIFTQQNLSQGH